MSEYEITGEPQEGGYIEQVELDLIAKPPYLLVIDIISAAPSDKTSVLSVWQI
jgi:hypothetical protein